jgi:hypothetical protein
MIFDLDPGEGAPWSSVQAGAELMRTLLRELKLPAFLKTSGGKGLHVVTPLKPQFDWDTVKSFSQAIVLHLAQHPARTVRGKERPPEPHRQGLHRLPAKRVRRDHRKSHGRRERGRGWAFQCRLRGRNCRRSRVVRSGR